VRNLFEAMKMEAFAKTGMSSSLSRSIFHNIGVAALGFAVALLGVWLDTLLGVRRIKSPIAAGGGWVSLAVGVLLRVWATFHFYERRMKVIALSPQEHLITTGPYRFSRNPLYLGGNVFAFFGTSLILGTVSGLFLVAGHLPLMDMFVRREERQLEQKFGDEWVRYKRRVRRWV
jgi:protein-S-isoprenylcysteine O-methyltransferase Ste14